MLKTIYMIKDDEDRILYDFGAWSDYDKIKEFYNSKIKSGRFNDFYTIEEIEINE